MNERNRSDCKYVEIFTHHAGSIGAPSGGTIFEGQILKFE
jgi:S-adenosylmethionine:tRNA-ribosyltransferase-isomerase (queuine synthetase)